MGSAIVFGDDLGLFVLVMGAGLFFVLVMGVMPVAIGAVTASLRYSDLAGGQQAARMLFENLARTNAFLDMVDQTPPTP